MTGRIVIVGGGFAGVHAAMHFDKALAHRSDIDVVLISRCHHLQVFENLVSAAGFEPATHALKGHCSAN